MVTFCPNCGTMYNLGDEYLNQNLTCTSCGGAFTATAAPVCQQCGSTNYPNSQVCYSCQAPLPVVEQPLSFDQEVAQAVQNFNKRKTYDALYWVFVVPCVILSAVSSFFLALAAIAFVLMGLASLIDDVQAMGLATAILLIFAIIGGGCLGGAVGLQFLYKKLNPDRAFSFGTCFLLGAFVGLLSLFCYLKLFS